MASIIQNFSLAQELQIMQPQAELPPQPFQFIENLLNNSPFQKYSKICRRHENDHTVRTVVYMEGTGSMEALAELMFDLKQSKIALQMRVLRHGKVLKMKGRGKINIFCRLLQKYNVHLAQHNTALFIDIYNATVVLRNPILIRQKGFTGDSLRELHDIASKNLQIIKDQVIYLLECANQNFESEIYARDMRYMDKVHMEMMETMRIRELIALSHISFQEESDAQNKYAKTKELISFLTNRESMVNPNLRKQGFLGNQMNLYCHFIEPFFFYNNTLPLAKLQSDFTKQFDFLFYKFQAKKMTDGDNPYLFNTILIKNEDKVTLVETKCQGGFSKIGYAEMEIAYKESQNLILDMPKLNSKSLKKYDDVLERPTKEKVVYFTKTIAIKLSKSQQDYQKIRHQKIIVQNFRTTTSPFILKYYNCTQRGFKYRQFLLMDYLGPTLTLSEHISLHPVIFSHQSKMHIFIHLANALIFLEKQMVVHMDLSTHNVMICRDLLVKLIDFGEAYHPYLDTDKTTTYLPGHTMPYCPPETFNQVKKFTPKSDVFSIGIMLYRTVLGEFPYLATPELKECYMERTYLERWMLAPEKLSEYGYQIQLTLLLQLISRCLSTDLAKRPNPYWIYVILNKIFLSFK